MGVLSEGKVVKGGSKMEDSFLLVSGQTCLAMMRWRELGCLPEGREAGCLEKHDMGPSPLEKAANVGPVAQKA